MNIKTVISVLSAVGTVLHGAANLINEYNRMKSKGGRKTRK